MPQRKPNTDSGDTELNKLLGGRDSAGKFLKRTAQIEKMRAVIEKLSAEQAKAQKQIEKSTKSVTTALKRENILLKGKNKLQNIISKSQRDQMKVISKAAKQREKQLKRETRLVQKNFKQQLRLETKLNRTRERLARKSRSGRGRGGFSLPQLGVGLAGLGLGVAAIRQIKDIADSRRSLAVSGGLSSLQNVKQFIGKDIAVISGAKLVDQFLQQSPTTLALGRDPLITKGLLRLQDELSGVGTDLANQIILGLSSSFRDPKRLKGFLGAISSGKDIEQTLRQFQTQNNVTETLRALNALGVTNLPTTGDDILDIQRELVKTTEKLKAEFERFSSTVAKDMVGSIKQLTEKLGKILEFLGGLSTKEFAIGAGVAAIGTGALAFGGSAIARAGLKLAVRGGGALLPAGLAGAAAVAAPIAIGGAIAIHKTNQTKQSLREALSANERQSLGLRRLDESALRLERDGHPLRAKRTRIERQITAISPAKTESSFLFGNQLTGEFTPQQNRQLAKLNKQRSAIQNDIDSLQTREQIETKVIQSKRKEIKSVEDATKSVNNFAEKLKKAPVTETKIDRDLSLLFKRADLEINAIESQSQTALRRTELEIAKIGPFGILQAGQEASKFLDQLQSQEAVLREILGTLDLSTREGRIHGNQLLLQVRNLQREEKELRRSLVTAFLDQSLSQALGAGRFSKILVTSDQNVGIGLRQGVFGLPKDIRKQLLGSVDPKLPKVQPRTALEVLQGRSPFDIRKLTPKMSNKRQSQKTRKSNLSGSTSGDSLINIGNELKKVGQQIKTENQDVDNKLNEPITTYAGNRLINVQPN